VDGRLAAVEEHRVRAPQLLQHLDVERDVRHGDVHRQPLVHPQLPEVAVHGVVLQHKQLG